MRSRVLGFLLILGFPLACGSGAQNQSGFQSDASTGGGDSATTGSGDGGGGDASFGDDSSLISNRKVVALSIQPLQANIESLNGASATQPFQALAKFDDGTIGQVSASWSRDNPQVGQIDATGIFTANG